MAKFRLHPLHEPIVQNRHVTIPPDKKRAINEMSVRQFFAAWEPGWRWMLILGLRDLRRNVDRLGSLAAAETGHDSWAEEGYLYGPMALGLTAAAVNECAQYCEDLFALLTFLRDPTEFVKRMTSYSAGRVTGLAQKLVSETDDEIRRRFLVPAQDVIERGVENAADPVESAANVAQGANLLGTLTREIANWYLTYEFFHVQYKHGLKLALRPFAPVPSAEAIKQRKASVKAPLFAFSNEPLSKMVTRPPQQQAMMFNLTPDVQPHLSELVEDRALLRIQLAGPEVDLDDVVGMAEMILRFLRIATANRLAVSGGLDEHRMQDFQLPGSQPRQVMTARLELAEPVRLRDF